MCSSPICLEKHLVFYHIFFQFFPIFKFENGKWRKVPKFLFPVTSGNGKFSEISPKLLTLVVTGRRPEWMGAATLPGHPRTGLLGSIEVLLFCLLVNAMEWKGGGQKKKIIRSCRDTVCWIIEVHCTSLYQSDLIKAALSCETSLVRAHLKEGEWRQITFLFCKLGWLKCLRY